MTTYVLRDGKLVEKWLARRQVPAVISDTMEPMQHMATGRVHTSKAAFRADTRAAGCIEVGNDPAALRGSKRPEPNTGEIVADIKRAMQELNR